MYPRREKEEMYTLKGFDLASMGTVFQSRNVSPLSPHDAAPWTVNENACVPFGRLGVSGRSAGQ
jgi:hypothetical protein